MPSFAPPTDTGKAPLKRFHDMPGHLIRRCHQIAVALFMDRCREQALTPIQFAVLSAVDANPGADQASVAGMVALDRATSGDVVARLAERGLLKREVNAKDKRMRSLLLTDEGRTVLAAVLPQVEAVQDGLLAPLSDQEAEAFLVALKKIAEHHNDVSRAPQRG